MKRTLLYCAVSALILPLWAACNPSEEEDLTADYKDMSFSAQAPVSAVDLGWSDGESISIFDGKANHEFKASGSGSQVTFSGTANSKAKSFMGLSPYNGKLQRYSGKVSVTVPTSQKAVNATLDPDAKFMAAYTAAGSGALEFKLMPAILKLDIEGIGYNIVSVQIAGKNGEVIAGDCQIGLFETPTIEAKTSGSAKVTLSGTGINGVYYVATIPQNFTDGLTVSISDENDARCEITVPALETKAGEIADLGQMKNLDLREAVNPNPTSVEGAVIVKASFREADFNIVSDNSFEDFPTESVGTRTSWKGINGATTRVTGRTGSYGWRLDNPTPGVWFDMYYQCIGFRQNTDYVYSTYGMAGTPHAYHGVILYPSGQRQERGGSAAASWSDYEEDTQWVYVEQSFNSGSNFYGDVFCGLWGDAGAFVTMDDVRVIPKGYDKMSMATVSAEKLAGVMNQTFDEIQSYGQAVAWKCSDGKIAIGFSNAVINGVTYSTAIAYTDDTTLNKDLTIVKFIKSKGKISSIVTPTGGETSVVPDAVFSKDGKLYLHYFAKWTEDGANAWTTSRSGFAVSEDDGKTWAETGGSWNGNGKYSQAGFVSNGGYTYMVGAAPGRTNDYYCNFFAARVADGKDLTDPAAYEYWTGSKYEEVGEAGVGSEALLSVGDTSEPALVYNAKFGRYMLIYRSNKHRGLVYRDADSPEGVWSGEKVLTDDDKLGTLSAPVVLDIDADGNVILLATKVL
jgi:hypothetical protein